MWYHMNSTKIYIIVPRFIRKYLVVPRYLWKYLVDQDLYGSNKMYIEICSNTKKVVPKIYMEYSVIPRIFSS